MSLLSGYWLLFFHNTKMKLSSSSITQQWMLWCLPFVLNQSIDTYKQKSFLLSNKKCYSLTWPDNERNKGAKTCHCTTCSMALVINTIKGKCNHVSWNSFKKSCFRALEVWTIGAIAQSWGKCKMEEESHPLMSFKIRLNFKAKPICKSYFVTTWLVWNDIDFW